jgi:hypothetical protein
VGHRHREPGRGGALPAMAMVLALLGCRGDEPGDERGREKPAPPAAEKAADPSGGQAKKPQQPPATEPRASPPSKIELEAMPAGSDERALLARAMPAWTAVRARATLLARRGQRGAVWGRVIPPLDGTLWLLDETEAATGLGIRMVGAGQRELSLAPGRRVVAWGSWSVDRDRRWVWTADRLVALPASAVPDRASPAPSSSVAPLPGQLVGELAEPPEGAVVPSQRQKAGPVVFAVVAAPVKPGDGWAIADQSKGPATAALLLPGEAPIYGGLDYRSPDERWPLEPGQWYAVSATVPRRSARGAPGAGELPVLRAAAAPVRVPPPPAPPVARRPKR